MGFDNECILNIHPVPAEYLCPVCRTLVYPNEALHASCNHLYCKPCLVHIASSSQACPYDGCLITESNTKPLVETNKALAETIEKVFVRCLYHRSGCMWQGPLSDCVSHRSGCAFGNSLVICTKCQIQIMHREAEEHAQICNLNNLNQPAVANPQPQALPATVMSNSQGNQPQYQQYYQLYPQPPLQVQGPTQAPGQPQYQSQQSQPPLYPQAAIPGPIQNQGQLHLNPQAAMPGPIQNQAQQVGQGLPNLYPQFAVPDPIRNQAQQVGQGLPNLYPQVAVPDPIRNQAQQVGQGLPNVFPQVAVSDPIQNEANVIPQQQIQPAVLPNVPPQLYFQGHAQQHMQTSQFQQPQPFLGRPDTEPQSQNHPHPLQSQPSTGSVPPGHVPAQFVQPIVRMGLLEPSQKIPSQPQAPGIPPDQQYINHPVHQVQQPICPPIQQPPPQGIAVVHDMQPRYSHVHSGRPDVLNQKGQYQPHRLPQSSITAYGAPYARPPEFGSSQSIVNQNDVNLINQRIQPSTTLYQENKPESLKFSHMDANGARANNLSEIRPESNMNKGPCWQLGGSYPPCSAAMLAKGPNSLTNHARSFEPQYPGLQYEYSQNHYRHRYEPSRQVDQSFPHRVFGDSSGTESPNLQSCYTSSFHAGGSDSLDNSRKRKVSAGWCRICKVDCQTVQGLEMHGQTHDHKRMALDMVYDIKEKSARLAKTSGFGEAGGLGSAGSCGWQ